ncbi:MAG: hypothetical protein GX817_03740 [Elusimicrobia bacterium]|nr:hypothetical protein [Elusimicrobiota bacterium]
MYRKVRLMLLLAGSFFLSSSIFFIPLRSFISSYLIGGMSVTVFTYEEDFFKASVNTEPGLIIRKHITSEEGIEDFCLDTGVSSDLEISLPSAFNLGFDPYYKSEIEDLIGALENMNSVGELVYSDEMIDNTLSLVSRLGSLFLVLASLFAVSGLLFIYAGIHIYIGSRRNEFILSEHLGYGRYIPALSAFRKSFLYCFLGSAFFSGIISIAIYYISPGSEIFYMMLVSPLVAGFTAGLFSLFHIYKETK